MGWRLRGCQLAELRPASPLESNRDPQLAAGLPFNPRLPGLAHHVPTPVAPVMLSGAMAEHLPSHSSTPHAGSPSAGRAASSSLPSLHGPGMVARIALKPAEKSGAGKSALRPKQS